MFASGVLVLSFGVNCALLCPNCCDSPEHPLCSLQTQAFSAYGSHLTAVIIYYGAAIFM
jgi:hypothetical protein